MGGEVSKEHWQKDEDVTCCNACQTPFTLATRRHHCRNCGLIFCANCSSRTCTIPMRNISEQVRVCDTCYEALAATFRGHSAPAARPRQPAAPPVESARAERAQSVPPAPGAAERANPSQQESPPSGAADLAAPAATGSATPEDEADEEPSITEEERNLENYYQSMYNNENNQVPPTAAAAQQHEAAERAQLHERWATVRQEAQFFDVVVQQAERVEPDTMVEYSRETENITLQPEVPLPILGKTLLPLPRPVENSTRLLLEPFVSGASSAGASSDIKMKGVDAIVARLTRRVPSSALCPTKPRAPEYAEC